MKCTKCGCTVMIFDPQREGWYKCERCGTEFQEREDSSNTIIDGKHKIDFKSIPNETKEKMFIDIYHSIQAPCQIEGIQCPLIKYGMDCDKDNDNHCACRDFIYQCLVISEG